MTCADYHAWQGAIQFGLAMCGVLLLLALVIWLDRRR